MANRRDFLKKSALAAAAAPLLATGCKRMTEKDKLGIEADPTVENRLIVEPGKALPITGTFLDEISHDIPHQNWGEREWDRDFRYMKAIGIDTVIDIRCGYRKFITYPSPYLLKKGCYMPSVDLIDMFCRLAQKYGMKFWLGLYDSGKYWDTGDMSYEVEANKYVIDEVWELYGSKYKSFGGWYISGEISRATKGAIESFRTMGRQCKEVSGGLPTFISPWIDGKKAVDAASGSLTKEQAVSVQQHEREWDEIFDGIHEYVDACAFQDGYNTLISVAGTTTYLSISCNRIGNRAVANCPISRLDMHCKEIGEYAFLNCTNLTTLSIPSECTRIDANAFYGCYGLNSITVNSTTPPVGGDNMFYNTNNCPIYVPAASVNAYKAALYWSAYENRIRAIQN